MASKDYVRVGIVGAGFIGHLRAEALAPVPNVEVVALASPTADRGQALATPFGIPRHVTDDTEMLALADLDMATAGVPDDRHARVYIDAAEAGPHVVRETPLCLTLADADPVIAAGRANDVKMVYAEDSSSPRSMSAPSWSSTRARSATSPWSSRARSTLAPTCPGSGTSTAPAAVP